MLLTALVGFDLAQAPQQQISARGMLAAIDLYQATLSRAMPRLGVSCRFTPTCSRYGEEAIRARGAGTGLLLALRRVGRCGPWTARGTYDPPPEPVARAAGP